MKQRRQFLRELVGAVGMAAAPAWAGSVLLTPRQSAGPFYPTELPLDNDNDLTRVAGQGDVAKGAIADLSGRILDQGGALGVVGNVQGVERIGAMGFDHFYFLAYWAIMPRSRSTLRMAATSSSSVCWSECRWTSGLKGAS